MSYSKERRIDQMPYSTKCVDKMVFDQMSWMQPEQLVQMEHFYNCLPVVDLAEMLGKLTFL